MFQAVNIGSKSHTIWTTCWMYGTNWALHTDHSKIFWLNKRYCPRPSQYCAILSWAMAIHFQVCNQCTWKSHTPAFSMSLKVLSPCRLHTLTVYISPHFVYTFDKGYSKQKIERERKGWSWLGKYIRWTIPAHQSKERKHWHWDGKTKKFRRRNWGSNPGLWYCAPAL